MRGKAAKAFLFFFGDERMKKPILTMHTRKFFEEESKRLKLTKTYEDWVREARKIHSKEFEIEENEDSIKIR